MGREVDVIWRFVEFRLDLGTRMLHRGDEPVHLSPKAFEVLRILIKNQPIALSKDDLLQQGWPNVFVSQASLTRAVTELREALDDPAQTPRLIRTVHGYGYSFIGDAVSEDTEPHAAPRCWLVSHTREYPLTDGTHVIGRDADVSVRLPSPSVSRRHARITVNGISAAIEDLSSKNGTIVRNATIAAATVLADGDDIRIGEFVLTFRVERFDGSTETRVTVDSR
jgi:DNA-binding winged helix-turn-helix (wHTH) protein